MPLDESGSGVLNQEGEKKSCHEDCCRRRLVTHLPETFVFEHEIGVGEEMDEGRRDDDTRSELSEDGEDEIVWADERNGKDGEINSDCACEQHGEY